MMAFSAQLRLALAAAAVAGSVACGGSGSPVAPQAATPAAPLIITGDPVLDLTQGESRTLQVEERDAGGVMVSRPASNFTWTSSNPGLVSIDATGLARSLGPLGQAIITARASSGIEATKRIWVQPPEHVPSTFRITLMFNDDIPPAWREDFLWAAARWQQVIRTELPEAALVTPPKNVCGDTQGAPPVPALSGATTGTVVLVEKAPGSGAFGGPCTHRPWPAATTIFGRVTIGSARGNADGELADGRRIALHELGHTLGLVAIIQGVQPPWFDLFTQRFSGPIGLEGYRRQSGARVDYLTTAAAHWTFGNDVMSTGNGSIRITQATVGVLMDIGYPAAWYGADR